MARVKVISDLNDEDRYWENVLSNVFTTCMDPLQRMPCTSHVPAGGSGLPLKRKFFEVAPGISRDDLEDDPASKLDAGHCTSPSKSANETSALKDAISSMVSKAFQSGVLDDILNAPLPEQCSSSVEGIIRALAVTASWQKRGPELVKDNHVLSEEIASLRGRVAELENPLRSESAANRLLVVERKLETERVALKEQQEQISAERGRVRELKAQVLVQRNRILELEGIETNLRAINSNLSVTNAALDFEIDDLRDQIAALKAQPPPSAGPDGDR